METASNPHPESFFDNDSSNNGRFVTWSWLLCPFFSFLSILVYELNKDSKIHLYCMKNDGILVFLSSDYVLQIW